MDEKYDAIIKELRTLNNSLKYIGYSIILLVLLLLFYFLGILPSF